MHCVGARDPAVVDIDAAVEASNAAATYEYNSIPIAYMILQLVEGRKTCRASNTPMRRAEHEEGRDERMCWRVLGTERLHEHRERRIGGLTLCTNPSIAHTHTTNTPRLRTSRSLPLSAMTLPLLSLILHESAFSQELVCECPSSGINTAHSPDPPIRPYIPDGLHLRAGCLHALTAAFNRQRTCGWLAGWLAASCRQAIHDAMPCILLHPPRYRPATYGGISCLSLLLFLPLLCKLPCLL